jgi:hypothetical protein
MSETQKTTRRSALKSIGAAGAAAILGPALFSVRAEAVARPADAFALVGDRFHNFD